ncbi:hypothetical protein QQF64_025195 [Cirrhinus molitorella]|uniref:Uncharacterized protein n=1 Tax=Cirrhinus molitorella TaxID=172907 RepID=A0ABR3NNC8_9TELE
MFLSKCDILVNKFNGDIIKPGQIHTLQQNQQSMVIISETLLPGRQYVADVQVAVHPTFFTSMWSEWSNSVEWTYFLP